jgi:catechol O-methyltransferase
MATTTTQETTTPPFDPSTGYLKRTTGPHVSLHPQLLGIGEHKGESIRYEKSNQQFLSSTNTFFQFDDGREIQLLHFVHNLPNIDEIRGSPQKVIEAIDLYCRTENYMMNVGPAKGKIVTDLIAEVKPETMVELGGYSGYSAVLFGDAVRRAGGKRYMSLERNPEFAAVSRSLVDLAGLSDIVKVHVGRSDLSIQRLHESGEFKKVELMFIDHYKPSYKADLKLCECLGLVTPGSVIAADNVIYPGSPLYLEYVRSTVEKKKQDLADAAKNEGHNGEEDLRSKAQYKKQVGSDTPAVDFPGNPNLIYETRLVRSYEPTGEPVSFLLRDEYVLEESLISIQI